MANKKLIITLVIMKKRSISTKQTYRIRKNFKAVNNSTNSSEDDTAGLKNLSLQLPQFMVNCYMFRTAFKRRMMRKVTTCPRYILHFC
jgi:hypothetical protein